MVVNTQATIWDRIISEEGDDLSPEIARYILRLGFKEEDQNRMHSLLAKARQGNMTPDEQTEAEEYRRAGDLLALWQSRARHHLKEIGAGNGNGPAEHGQSA